MGRVGWAGDEVTARVLHVEGETITLTRLPLLGPDLRMTTAITVVLLPLEVFVSC